MHQRNTAFGRPTGTDGSDFSYRMVGHSRCPSNNRTGFTNFSINTREDSGLRALDIVAVALGLVSLIIGELGWKHILVGLLRFFMVVSSFDAVLWMYCAVRRNSKIGTAENPSHWQGLFEFPEIVSALLGLLLHMFILGYTIYLIHNMSPPKRAS